MGSKAKSGAKSGIQTQRTNADVSAFIEGVVDPRRRDEGRTIKALMEELTGMPSQMWGKSIVGYGSYDYKSKSGYEATWMRIGFSPRKASLTIYLMPGFEGEEKALAALGPHKTSVGCLYVRRLADINMVVLRGLIKRSMAKMASRYPQR